MAVVIREDAVVDGGHFDGGESVVRLQDVLPDGTLIAADKNTHTVKFIAPDGTLLLVIGTGRLPDICPASAVDPFTSASTAVIGRRSPSSRTGGGPGWAAGQFGSCR